MRYFVILKPVSNFFSLKRSVTKLFRFAEPRSDIRIKKFKIADLIWLIEVWKNSWFLIKIYILRVFVVAKCKYDIRH